MGIERRRHARIRTSLEVQVEGIEARAALRRGDISLTGLYVETDASVQEPGSIHHLRLRSRDGTHQVALDARVIRVSRTDDLFRGSTVSGVAFEFLMHQPGVEASVRALVMHAAGLDDEDEALELPDDGRGVLAVRVDTRWKLRAGEHIRLELPSAQGANVSVRGRVERSRPHKQGHFCTTVEVEAVEPLDLDDRSIDGLRDAIAAVAAEQKRAATRREHLSGDLSRIQLPSLLSLVALEQMTGIVRLRGEGWDARVYVRGGQVLDVVEVETESGGAEVRERGERSARTVLASLCEARAGRFELTLEEVVRADRLGVSTTALLLDLARAMDEERRVA